MQATVLGGRGFVGAALVRALQGQGWSVAAPEKGDLSVLEAPLGVVFHCAGLTADYDARPFDTVSAHVELAAEVIRRGRFDRIIYLSSTRLYDGQATGEEAASLVLNPQSPRHLFDLSKALGENLTLTRTGGRGAVARLANVYDWTPGAPGFLSEWLAGARRQRSLQLASSPHVSRDYISLADTVAALIAMAKAPEAPGIVNVASGRLTSNHDLAAVFEALGWTITFSSDARPPPSPPVQVDRLASLGVRATPVETVVRSYLEGL